MRSPCYITNMSPNLHGQVVDVMQGADADVAPLLGISPHKGTQQAGRNVGGLILGKREGA